MSVSGCAHGHGPAARDSARTAESDHRLRVTTAFGPFSLPLIEEYRRVLPQLEMIAVDAADSNAVVHALERDDADFGLAYADAVFGAYATAAGRRSASVIRGVSVLEPLPLYILVRNDAGIENVSDLRGHRLGALSTASLSLGQLLLRELGIDPSVVIRQPREELLAGLAHSTLDAVLISGWVRSTEMDYPSVAQKVHVLPVEGPTMERLRAEYPFIRRVTVPRVLYEGQKHAVNTVAMDVLVVCRDDLSESVVYEATRHLFLAYPRLSSVEATLRFLDLDEAAATPIPLHPGAARYFRERELSR